MNKKLNTTSMWNKLLNKDEYLDDFNKSASIRCNLAIQKIEKYRASNVLNVGSGQGFLEKLYFSKKYRKINWVSLDISTIGLERLKIFPISRVLGYAHNIPLKNSTFDCCICMEVIEHIPKVKSGQVLKELNRILNKNGHLILTVPIYEPVSLKNHPVGHMRKFSPQEIINEIERENFLVESVNFVYPFDEYSFVKSIICKLFNFRRPSIIFLVCKKI